MRKALAALALIASPLALAADLGGDGLGGPSLQPRAQSAQLGEPGIANRELSQVDPVLIEAGEPALDFRFAKNKSLIESASGKTSLVNFSRSAAQSPGTYVGADGLIHTAAVNLALYSEQFDNAYWTKQNATIKANQIAAPDGKQTADAVVPTSGSHPYCGFYASDSNPPPKTISFYVKKGSQSYASIFGWNGISKAWFDLENISVGALGDRFESSGIENVGQGWLRVWANMKDPIPGYLYGIYFSNADNSTACTGDGTTVAAYIWGAQLEETDPATMAPTAYIHTTSQALAAPRFDHVPTTGNVTTNLLTYSEMFDVGWSTARLEPVTANATTAPDGSTTADYIEQQSGQTTRGGVYQIRTLSGSFVASVYAKAAEKNFLQIFAQGGAYSAFFDLQNGTVGTVVGGTATITDAGDGWYRCALTASTSYTGNLIYYLADADNSTTVTDSGGIYLYGAQLEAASTPGPYVRTLSETRGISDANAESLGLLVEEQRANLIPYSDQIETAFSSRIGMFIEATDADVSPDGKNTADLHRESATTGAHEIYRGGSFSSGTYAWSIFVKQGAGNRVLNLCASNGASNYFAVRFDLQSEEVASPVVLGAFSGVSGQLEDYGNGWFRATVIFTSSTLWYAQIGFSTSNTSTIGSYGLEYYAGDNTSSMYFFGAQVESATFPTSYIPTTGSSQTRYADVAAVQDEDFATTNLLSYSESFDVGWTTGRLEPVTANATTAPDGTISADYIEQLSGNTSAGYILQTTSGQKTVAVYAKAAEKNFLRIDTGSNRAYFDLSTGTVGTVTAGNHAVMQDDGNGWYRCILMAPASSYAAFYLADTDNSATVTGSGGIYLWGASLTATEYPVEYVTTRNLIEDSQDFERSTWLTVASGAANPVVNNDFGQAPDGTNTADKIDFGDTSASTGNYSVIYNPTTNLQIGKIYRASLYVKAATASDVGRKLYAYFEATINEFTLTADWQRIEYWAAASGATKNFTFGARGASSLQPAFSALVWGAQMEPAPDITTTATDYVRTVDVVGKDYGWYEPTEGTVLSSHNIDTTSGNRIPVAFSDGTTSNQIYLGAGNGFSGLTITLGGAPQVGLFKAATAPADTNILHVAGFAYNDSAYRTNIGSMALESTSSGSIPNVNKMFIGGYNVSGVFSGHVKRLTYWPRRQSDSTLQVITQ